MKTMYYLAPSLTSVDNISHELERSGVKDWFIHIVSNDESGLKKHRLHSSNYLETLDLVRDGLIGGLIGLAIGLIAVGLANWLMKISTRKCNQELLAKIK